MSVSLGCVPGARYASPCMMMTRNTSPSPSCWAKKWIRGTAMAGAQSSMAIRFYPRDRVSSKMTASLSAGMCWSRLTITWLFTARAKANQKPTSTTLTSTKILISTRIAPSAQAARSQQRGTYRAWGYDGVIYPRSRKSTLSSTWGWTGWKKCISNTNATSGDATGHARNGVEVWRESRANTGHAKLKSSCRVIVERTSWCLTWMP